MAEKPLIASPHLRRYRLTGCHTASIVLERLTWWWLQGTRIIYGVEWRAKPRDQLAMECGLSFDQTKRALNLLEKRFLIERSQHRFGKTQDAVMHYRLLPRALGLFEGTEYVENPAPSGWSTDAPPLNMAEIETNTSYGSIEEPTEVFVAKSSPQVDGFSGKEEAPPPKVAKAGKTMFPKTKTPPAPAAPKPVLTAKEMLAAKALTGSFPGKTPKKGKDTLGQVWSKAVAAAYPGHFVPPLTQKQLGQLTLFRKRVAPLDAELLLRRAVASWGDFVLKASSEAGAFGLSKRPDVGVVLRFAGVAADLATEETKAVVLTTTTYLPATQTLAQSIAQDDAVTPEKASKEQVLALLSKPKGK